MSVRRIKQGIMLIMVLMSILFLIPKEQVSAATEWVEIANQQDMDTSKLGNKNGGVSYQKSGFLITLVNKDGTPVLNSGTCYFGYNGANYQGSGITNWFGVPPTNKKFGTVVNEIAFLTSQAGVPSGGDTLACKLQEVDPSTGNQYAHEVIFNCLGVNKQDLLQYLATGETLYLQLTGIYWCNQPNGQSLSGSPIAGNTWQMSQKIAMSGTPVSGVAHKGAPNSALLSEAAWGITNTSPTQVKVDTGTIKANGLGVSALRLSDSYQVVICIETPTGWNTTYLSTGLTYTVLAKYQGYDFVEGQVNKRKTKETSASSSYSAVCSNVEEGGAVTRSAGVGAFKFNVNAEEHALFLHYKGNIPIPTTTEADLYAWELGYRMPHAGGEAHEQIRTKADTEDYGVKLDEIIEEWQMSTKPATPSGSDTVKYRWVVKKKSVKHTYKMSGNQGDFTKAIWNLYRKSAPHYDLWDKYNDALGEDEWHGWESVDPKFSYYLMRSQLEGLALSPSGTHAGNGSAVVDLLVAGKGANFEISWKDLGKGKSPQAASSKKTWENQCTYKFSYTGSVINEQTEGRAEAWIIWKLQKSTRSAHSHGTGCSAGCSKQWEAWSAWSDVGTEKEFKKKSFSPDKWNGTYASYNIDKYKTQATGTGSSETAGNQTVVNGGTDGLDVGGKIASQIGKGGASTLLSKWGSSEIHNAATSSSQFKNNIYNLYGEVMMLFWKNSDSELYKEPLQAMDVYVMSEYERHIIPPLVHGFKTSVVGGTMKGIGSLTTPATGKTASEVKSAANPSMGVTYMGTGFNIATTSKYRIDFGTAGLTISDNDEGANAKWGNKKTDVKARHSMYMGSVLSGIGQEIIMEFTFKPSGQKVYYILLTSDANDYEKNTDDLGKDDVDFIHGAASGGNASAIEGYTAGGVEGYLALTKMFDGTMISDQESYTGQKNESGPAHENNLASHSGSFGHISYGNWYDEESNHRFCIEKYHSWVIFDYVQAEDKIDYNLLTANVASKYLNQSKYITTKFYTRLYRNNVDYTDGLYNWPGAPTLRIDMVHDESTGGPLSFAIINQSTEDMKRY